MKKKKRDKERNQFWISCMRGYSSGWRYIIQTLKRYAFHSFSRFSKKKKTKKRKKKGEEEEENNEGKIPLESEAGFFCCSLRLLMNEESLPLQDWMPVLYSRCATLPEKTDCRPLAIVYGNWTQRIDRWMPLTTGSHIGYWPLCCYRTCPPSTLKVTLHLNIHRNGYIETSQ